MKIHIKFYLKTLFFSVTFRSARISMRRSALRSFIFVDLVFRLPTSCFAQQLSCNLASYCWKPSSNILLYSMQDFSAHPTLFAAGWMSLPRAMEMAEDLSELLFHFLALRARCRANRLAVVSTMAAVKVFGIIYVQYCFLNYYCRSLWRKKNFGF